FQQHGLLSEKYQTKNIVWCVSVKLDALERWDFDRRTVDQLETLLTTHTEEEKDALHEDTSDHAQSRVAQLERVRRHDLQRSTPTNLSFHDVRLESEAAQCNTKKPAQAGFFVWSVWCGSLPRAALGRE